MAVLMMPEARGFGWELKPTSSTDFEIIRRENGQLCVVLNHSLLRGCSAEMIHWWFLHFPTLRVKLVDIGNYQETTVPGYLLWHPTDHLDATLSGKLGPGNTSHAGARIQIREAMNYPEHGWKYKVDTKLTIFYCERDGWAMGLELPVLGRAMVLRIHFVDVTENGNHLGVHYHYEIVVGLSGNHFIARQFNRRLTRKYSSEFFDAWHLHNCIEVGVFENFLPALFAQRTDLDRLHYAKEMNPVLESPSLQQGFDRRLFDERVEGYKTCRDPFEYQKFLAPTFVSAKS